ncbi:MAG: hypothetical protein EOO52_13715 [Gammaproteobacteria bacterium]|nr:MAG: hypothetical protein EOO52_13715 [Gammaproteobacteria bacterium]
MLSTNELEDYLIKHNVSAAGRAYITSVRTREPSRMVSTHAKLNVVSWVPSRNWWANTRCLSITMKPYVELSNRVAEWGKIINREH